MTAESDVARLLRAELAGLEPYVPIHPFEVLSARLGRPAESIVKLDANENPYGPSPAAIEALATYRWHHIYPDPQSTELRTALAAATGVPAERILAGSGADELIDLLCRLFLSPGDALLDCPPTFGMYAFGAAASGARLVAVPRRPDFALDLDGIEAAVAADRPKLLFLCSPNNPDGGLLPAAALQRLLQLPLVVVVDEAYAEFARPGSSFIPWVADHANLVVLRTFSKWAGLGGLRVGYGIFPPLIIEQLWKIKPPYNVNVAGTRAALASLAGREALMGNVARLVAERERLYDALAACDFLAPVPGSEANFILCRVKGRDARELKLALEQQGVLVRHFARPGLENCIRISAGRPADTDALLAALAAAAA